MKHEMSDVVKKQFVLGKWYKDKDGDFHKFKSLGDNDIINVTATVFDGEYECGSNCCGVGYFNNQCILMTIEEMKEHLPEHEWWSEPSDNLFPIY